MSKASKLIDDLKAAGYRAHKSGYMGQYEIVVEGQAGALSANAPKAVSGAVRISKDGEQVGTFVGIGSHAYDDLTATGVPAIRALLLGEHPPTKAEVDAAVKAAEAEALPEPFGPKYQERTERGSTGNECVICGKQTSRNGRTNAKTIHVRVVGGGGRFALPDEVADEAGDMGYFPVGSECAKSIPKAYHVTLGEHQRAASPA